MNKKPKISSENWWLIVFLTFIIPGIILFIALVLL